MCGICGIVHRDQSLIDTNLLERMNSALTHRGPDSSGTYIQPGIGLAMRRLKIIDLLSGDQPICNEDETLWTIFNGEIYNYQELREHLLQKRHRLKTNSDTECILHLYEEYGLKFLDFLRGMFAIALWDQKKRQLLLVRDRLGKKPLFYTQRNGSLIFSSEIPSLLCALSNTPPPDITALNLYLSCQFIPSPLSAFQGIQKLPPAHYLLWDSGKIHIESYWDVAYTPKLQGDESELVQELRTRLRESIQLRMVSDVPIGMQLSGGIDSSVIVAEMANLQSAPTKTFSLGFREEPFSELPYARMISDKYHTDHHEIILTYEHIPQTITEILRFTGEPLADPSAIPLFHLAKLTRDFVSVAINGDGGDEGFAGYSRYWLDPWANVYCKLPGIITKKLVPALAGLLPDRSDHPSGKDLINGIKRLKHLVQIDPRASLLRWGSYFPPQTLAELWQSPFIQEINPSHAEEISIQWFERALASSFLDRTLYSDIHTYLPDALLVKADRMSMAHSLEGRSPFLDHKLLEWSARLPEKYKVKGLTGKVILRKAYRSYLPEQIWRRGKQGFGIPINAWCRGPLLTWLKETLLDAKPLFKSWFNAEYLQRMINEHQTGRIDHGKRLWALAVLSKWSEIY
jgi:asparagine synthase (glutamine-hydrolysing)